MKWYKVILVISCAAIALVLSLYAYASVYSEPIKEMLTDPLWVSVFVTVVLVVINISSAWQTRQTINEMKMARKADFLPHVKATLIFLGPRFLLLRMTNVGKGPALDIKITISFLPGNIERSWRQSMMAPSEINRILLPDGNIDTVCEKAAKITVKGNYSDIFGQSFKIDENIDTKEFIDEMKQLSQLVEPDLQRLVSDIKDEMQALTSEIKRIRYNIRPDKTD
jgi:hypothetical protein